MHSKTLKIAALALGLSVVAAALSGLVFLNKQNRHDAPTAHLPPVPGKSRAAGIQGTESVADLQALADSIGRRALRKDTAGLIRLLVNDSVFRRHVWPVTRNYDPKRQEVFDFIWSMHLSNSAKGMVRLLHDIEARSEASLHAKVAAETRPGAEGAVLYEWKSEGKGADGIRLFASALALEGAYQVYSYSGAGLALGASPTSNSQAE